MFLELARLKIFKDALESGIEKIEETSSFDDKKDETKQKYIQDHPNSRYNPDAKRIRKEKIDNARQQYIDKHPNSRYKSPSDFDN